MNLEVEKTNLAQGGIVPSHTWTLGEGSVLFSIDKFACTANNVSYALSSETIGYGKFFPPTGETTTTVPAWGIGTVIASRCPKISVGSRYYGLYPMGSHLVVEPTQINNRGFMDGAAHRKDLNGAQVYNKYELCSSDNDFYHQKYEAEMLIFRPLFSTSWLLDSFLKTNKFFGSKNVIITSASSKTAYALAFLLHNSSPEANLVGLTSPSNKKFVESLRLYNKVVVYDDVPNLPLEPSVYVDMSGNSNVLKNIHLRLGDNLRHACKVGATHHKENILADQKNLPGPKPKFFFAPVFANALIKEVGPVEFARRIATDWRAFIEALATSGNNNKEKWCQVVERNDVANAFNACLNGIPPSQGLILSMTSSAKL